MSSLSEILISIFVAIGTFFLLAGTIGLARFPDVYNRIHAAGKGTTLGLTGILIGATIFFSIHFGLTLKLLLVIPFLFWTAPAGMFMMGRAAHRTGPQMAKETIRDDISGQAGTLKQHT